LKYWCPASAVIRAVEPGVVEVIPVDVPGLVEHLRPLGPRVHSHLDARDVELELRQVGLVGHVDEVPVLLDPHERALRVGAELEAIGLVEEGTGAWSEK
jgi:hypothetical protein